MRMRDAEGSGSVWAALNVTGMRAATFTVCNGSQDWGINSKESEKKACGEGGMDHFGMAPELKQRDVGLREAVSVALNSSIVDVGRMTSDVTDIGNSF